MKRYEPEIERGGSAFSDAVFMNEDPDGDWVRFKDVAELIRIAKIGETMCRTSSAYPKSPSMRDSLIVAANEIWRVLHEKGLWEELPIRIRRGRDEDVAGTDGASRREGRQRIMLDR